MGRHQQKGGILTTANTNQIHRSKERIRQTGEVFTPLELVDEMLSKLPEEVWAPDKTFLEPSCGDGNFLVRIVAWKIWKGSTAKQALETTYGVDLMPDNVYASRERLLGMVGDTPVYRAIVERNIRCENALTYDYSFI